MEKENKGIGQSMRDGFLRGYVGKEEDASMARILTSTEPLPNEIQKFRKYGYGACCVCLILGCFSIALGGLGLFGLMIICTIVDYMSKHKSSRLRGAKFKINPEVNNEILFSATQPVFVSKYNLLVEKNPEGTMKIEHNGCIYDIIIHKDGTFIIWWKTSFKKRLFLLSYYKLYRTILADMGIIAYEIQHAVGIN